MCVPANPPAPHNSRMSSRPHPQTLRSRPRACRRRSLSLCVVQRSASPAAPQACRNTLPPAPPPRAWGVRGLYAKYHPVARVRLRGAREMNLRARASYVYPGVARRAHLRPKAAHAPVRVPAAPAIANARLIINPRARGRRRPRAREPGLQSAAVGQVHAR